MESSRSSTLALVVIAAEHENEVDFSPQTEDMIEPGVLVIAGSRRKVDQVRQVGG
ncbi:MAG: hypothetical protein ACRDWS_04700 [Acidimicrobiia bacterium]